MMNVEIFKKVEGSKQDRELYFIGLSTCGFCRRAKSFLEEEGFAYSYVDVDRLDREVRLDLKADIRRRFTEDLLYPMLVIDDADFIKGFKKEDWLEKLA